MAWVVFSRLNFWVVGSIPTRVNGYLCVRLICLVLFALRGTDPLSKESYRLCNKPKKAAKAQQ
jgi:hypothetical protein